MCRSESSGRQSPHVVTRIALNWALQRWWHQGGLSLGLWVCQQLDLEWSTLELNQIAYPFPLLEGKQCSFCTLQAIMSYSYIHVKTEKSFYKTLARAANAPYVWSCWRRTPGCHTVMTVCAQECPDSCGTQPGPYFWLHCHLAMGTMIHPVFLWSPKLVPNYCLFFFFIGPAPICASGRCMSLLWKFSWLLCLALWSQYQ